MAIGDFFRDFFSGDSEGEYEPNGGETPENYAPQFEVDVDDEGNYRNKETGELHGDNEVRGATGTERDANDGNGDRNKRR